MSFELALRTKEHRSADRSTCQPKKVGTGVQVHLQADNIFAQQHVAGDVKLKNLQQFNLGINKHHPIRAGRAFRPGGTAVDQVLQTRRGIPRSRCSQNRTRIRGRRFWNPHCQAIGAVRVYSGPRNFEHNFLARRVHHQNRRT